MTWMQRLYETYESNVDRVGDQSDRYPLLPVLHLYQTAHLEIVLNLHGEFLRAVVVTKETGGTIIPCTEASMGRSGTKPVNHPLCDGLQYVAGDFSEYGGIVTSGFNNEPSKPYEDYLRGLQEWCSSEHSHSWVDAVRKYVSQKRVIRDLVSQQTLHVDVEGRLLQKWPSRTPKPDIFRTLNDQHRALVRWAVEVPGQAGSKLHHESTVWQSWTQYYLSRTGSHKGKIVCAVSGLETIPASMYPKKILNSCANAKLISFDDKRGYTYRGRFTNDAEACTIGIEVSYKAHSALTWLIGRGQAHLNDTQAVVAWAISGKVIPNPFADTESLFGGRIEDDEPDSVSLRLRGDTGQAFAIRLSKRIAGYKTRLGPADSIVVLGLDAVSSKFGRMAITFYRELSGSEFLDRIEAWHRGLAWFQRLAWDKRFVGAPAPVTIAEVAYGRFDEVEQRVKVDTKVLKATTERLLPCIIDGRPMPRDIVDLVVRRVAYRVGMKSIVRKIGNCRFIDEFEWEKSLGVACALFRGLHSGRSYEMGLEENRNTRDYLYGRLLAIAERLEGMALYLADETRDTTAARLMQRFADRPYSTWLNIEKGLQPYKSRLQVRAPGFLFNVCKLLDEVHDQFDPKEYMDDRRLSGEYLLGYHCQRRAFKLSTEGDNALNQNELQNEEDADI